MERIPILKMGPYLLVTIQVDMHDRIAMTLQDELTQRIVRDGRGGCSWTFPPWMSSIRSSAA